MSVRTIHKSYYTTDELITLAKNILAKAEGLSPENAAVKALSASLSTAYQTLLSSRIRGRHNTQTELLVKADQERDLAFRAFYSYVKAGTFRRNEAYRRASEAVMAHFKKFDRNLINFGYARQSVELTRLFTEMEEETSNLTTIGAMDWLAELKAAEKAFLEQHDRKIDEDTEQSTLVPVKESREQVVNQLLALVSLLNGLEMAKTEGIAALNSEIDEVIAQVEIPAKARLSRREGEEDQKEAGGEG